MKEAGINLFPAEDSSKYVSIQNKVRTFDKCCNIFQYIYVPMLISNIQHNLILSTKCILSDENFHPKQNLESLTLFRAISFCLSYTLKWFWYKFQCFTLFLLESCCYQLGIWTDGTAIISNSILMVQVEQWDGDKWQGSVPRVWGLRRRATAGGKARKITI